MSIADKSVLDSSPYSELWDIINKVKVRIKDKYRGSIRFPIGTRKPIQYYPKGEVIPESEIVFFTMDTVAPDNATSNMFIGQSGTFKTTLLKTLTYYNSLIGNTKIGIMDLKGNSMDWNRCNQLSKPHPNMLFPEPTTLKILAGCPTFALRGMPEGERKKIRKLNLNPKEFADRNILQGLGFSPIAKQHLYKLLKSGESPELILQTVEKMYNKREITKPSYDNMSIILDNMISAEVLTNKDVFDINQTWNDGSHWALGFNNKELEFLSVYVDKALTTIFDRAQTQQGLKERYWVVVDDAQKAFGMDATKFPSVQKGIDSLTLWRSVGIYMNICIQSPTMLDEEIYSDIKHFFIYRCGNVNTLAKYIPNREIIENIRTLNYQPEKFISECIHVFPDRHRYERFYPFLPPIST